MNILKTIIKNQFIYFSIAGGMSTLFMLAIYVVLDRFINFQIAYFIAYLSAVIALYFFNSFFVFKSPLSLRTFLRFSMVYVAQYTVSAILLELMVKHHFSERLSPVIIIFLLLPLTFLLSRSALLK
ncbi:MAG: GtrA family protein [Gammaproteobacteria bacterium]|nr:GtrA family protein [Gammaproteobacteria bacterium]